MEYRYNKSSRSERRERKKNKDNIYTGKHVRAALEKQQLNLDKPLSKIKEKKVKK